MIEPKAKSFLRRHAHVFMYVIITCAFLYAVAQSNDAQRDTAKVVRDFERDGAERRDQTCKIFEGGHLEDIQRLRNTYRFLNENPRSEITKAVVQGLPEQEKRARTDSAPEYCDEPGAAAEAKGAKPVGLSEPDPIPPKRRDFSYLLR